MRFFYEILLRMHMSLHACTCLMKMDVPVIYGEVPGSWIAFTFCWRQAVAFLAPRSPSPLFLRSSVIEHFPAGPPFCRAPLALLSRSSRAPLALPSIVERRRASPRWSTQRANREPARAR